MLRSLRAQHKPFMRLAAAKEKKMRKITKTVVSAFMQHKPKWIDNTQSTGWELRLHGNLIARHTDIGLIEISLAGWDTLTTRERLNAIPGVNVYHHKGEPYLNGEPIESTGWHLINPLKAERHEYIALNIQPPDNIQPPSEYKPSAAQIKVNAMLDDPQFFGTWNCVDCGEPSATERPQFANDPLCEPCYTARVKANNSTRLGGSMLMEFGPFPVVTAIEKKSEVI